MHASIHTGRATVAAGLSPMGQPHTGGPVMGAAGDDGDPQYSIPAPRGADDPPILRRPTTDPTVPWQAQHAGFYAQQHQLRVWAGVRHEVVHRLVEMNLRHAMHAWNVRRDRPVAPWAVGFLYSYATGSEYDGIELYAVAAATRLVDHDEHLPGPAHLLYRLIDVAHERHRDAHGRFDPTTLCTYRDPVPTTAAYLGVAVSCLGTHTEPWEELRRGDTDDIPGHAYALLTDDSALLLHRGGRRDLRRVVIHATADLTHQRGLTDRRWISYPDVWSMPGADPAVWEQLHRLHVMAGHQRPAPILVSIDSAGRGLA